MLQVIFLFFVIAKLTTSNWKKKKNEVIAKCMADNESQLNSENL